MFGINLKYGFPFLAAMIGSMIAGVISVGSNVMANSIGVGGIPGFLSIQAQHMTMFAISMVVAIAVPFLLTIVFAKTRMNKFSFKK
jgi:PTS system trehalose-specific IIC component